MGVKLGLSHLRDVNTLRTFQNRELGNKLDLIGEKWQDDEENCTLRTFIIGTHQITISKEIGWERHLERMGIIRYTCTYSILVGNT
jgi:hypothetical protein